MKVCSVYSNLSNTYFPHPGAYRKGLPSPIQCLWSSLKLIGLQLIHCIPPTNQLTRREQELRKRIEGTVLLMAANDGTDIDEEELKRRVFTEEASKKVRTNFRDIVASFGGSLMSGF